MIPLARILLPAGIVASGVIIAWQLVAHGPKAEPKPVEIRPPSVRVVMAELQTQRVSIRSQGTVTPRTTITLGAEVGGRIVAVAPGFVAGGFFRSGDVLARINPEDYELALIRAEAQVASARQQLARAEAEYKQKLEEYRGVDPATVTDYALRRPQYEEAVAQLKGAEADLARARIQLARCEIRAPFDGRVLERLADVGQYAAPGAVLARLHAVDRAEVRLPVTPRQAELLDLPPAAGRPIRATLSGESGGRAQRWAALITRSDAMLDERNRLLNLIAEIDDPYGLRSDASRTPLAMGMFVEAEIEGRRLDGVVSLPRSALRANDTVWLVDAENRLRLRTVQVAYQDSDLAHIGAGLQAGERVIVSALDAVVDGMAVAVTP